MKAQSAIEYLITYGWMLVLVSIVGGGLYQFSADECGVEASGFAFQEIDIVDETVTSDGRFELTLRSNSNREIVIDGFEADNGSLNQKRQMVLEPGETRVYEVADVNQTEGCDETDLQVYYSVGPVSNQHYSGTLKMPFELIEAVIYYLERSGGHIDRLEVNSSITPTGSDVCVGDRCERVTGDEDEEVERSGDEMTGYLETREIEFNCFGDKCSVEEGDLPGQVSTQNHTMDGTLNVTNIVRESNLCLGRCK